MSDKTTAAAASKGGRKQRSQIVEIWGRLRKNKVAVAGLVIIALIVLLAILSPLLIDYETNIVGQAPAERLQGPSMRHIFGTDQMGRDIFQRLLYGSRYSLKIGLLATVVAAIIGIPLGALAGYFGGVIDSVIMRVSDIIGGIPSTLLAMCIVAALGTNDFVLIFAIGFSSINVYVKLTRAQVLTIGGNEFVESARAIGETEAEVIFKHILPNCLSPIIVQTTLRVGVCIIRASGLSFIGLGIKPPSPEWGAMLTAGRQYIRHQPYMTIFPGLAIMLCVVSLNLLGDGLRDAMDPKQK